MNITLDRLDPNVPDPVESRRRGAGRVVRIAYATIVFGVLAFFVVYFGAPLVYLGGPGTVTRRDGTGWQTFEVQATYTPVPDDFLGGRARRSDDEKDCVATGH